MNSTIPLELTINLNDFDKIGSNDISIALHSNKHDELILEGKKLIHLVYDPKDRVINRINYIEKSKLGNGNLINFKFQYVTELKYNGDDTKPYEEIIGDLVLKYKYDENKLTSITTSKGGTLEQIFNDGNLHKKIYKLLDENDSYLSATFYFNGHVEPYSYEDNKENFWHLGLSYENPYRTDNDLLKLLKS